MNILGLSFFYHDSAAALVQNGNILAAAQEERFTRKKHDSSFPSNSISFVLKHAGLSHIDNVDLIAFYDDPSLKFRRICESYLANAPQGGESFPDVADVWTSRKLFVERFIRKQLAFRGKVMFVKHHLSHAASAFFPSPYKRAAVLVVDGVGEWDTTSYWTGNLGRLSLCSSISFPHSLGLFYSALTYFAGFKVNSGEYKLMGLAPYGKPKYTDLFLRNLIDIKDDGSFRLNMEYFDHVVGTKATTNKLEILLGRTPRKPESPITQDDMDIARSTQVVLELAMTKIARHVRRSTGERFLCMAGGVALNCVSNGVISRQNIFDEIWIQPAAGDAGGALGAALYANFEENGMTRGPDIDGDAQSGTYLGPEYGDPEVFEFLQAYDIPHESPPDLADAVAGLLADQQIIGWFNGRMEFGPRALGSRSILGDARDPEMQKKMNLKIKFRESFRPFAPAVLEEYAHEWFDLKQKSPYMLLVSSVLPEKRIPSQNMEADLPPMQRLNVARSAVPAITHLDYSARLQTISKKTNPKFHQLISSFYKITGCPMVINTSFNVRGEPIVCTPEDAYRCFMRTNIDYLVLGSYLIDKRRMKPWTELDWQQEYGLD